MEASTPLRKHVGRKSLLNASITTASPLRKSIAPGQSPVDLFGLPDDEAERSKRRSVVDLQRKLTNISVSVPSPLTEINQLFDEVQIQDHLKICTKLYTENKISIKNAWELHVIDAIRKILTTNNDNVLQVAGSSLDIGAKVYGFRVDDVYSRGLKLASTMARSKENKDNEEADIDEVPDADKTGDTQTRKRSSKKKKRLVGNDNTIDKEGKSIFGPPKMLEPVLFSTKENIDLSATDNLFTYKLHVNPANQLLMLLTGEKYWVTSDDVTLPEIDQPIDIELPDISKTRLCESFKDFEIGDWDPESEENGLGSDTVVLDDKGLPIPELDGSIPDIFENGNDVPADSGSDTEGQQEEFQAQIHGEIAEIVDAIPEENRVETEYGYNTYIRTESGKFIDRIWAGPNHWKIKYVRPSTARFSGSTAGPVAKHVRKAKVQERIDFSVRPKDVVLNEITLKRAPATTAIEKITLPVPELLYENFYTVISEFLTKPGVSLPRTNRVGQQNQEYEVPVYNYENLNDSQYCSQHNVDDDNGADMGNGSFEEEVAPAGCQNLFSEELVNEPEIITAEHVPYALQAKKMDMKKLKTAVWKKLTHNADGNQKEAVVYPMRFSKLYKELPELLNKDMKKELSCPLAFAALLHLCNENNLELRQFPGDSLKDFVIQKAK